MIDQKPKKTRRQPNLKILPQLQLLKLEKLERVVGVGLGPIICPDCNDK